MELKIELNGDIGILHMEGDLTVHRADEIKAALTSALNSVDHVVLEIKNSSDIDMACLQLLCSVHRTAISMGKKIELSEHCPQPLRDVSALAGFLRRIGCIDDCLWKCEE